MPSLNLNLNTRRGITFDGEKSYVNHREGFYSLRRLIGTQYTIEGLYSESDIITFANHAAYSMKDLYGFEHSVEFDLDIDGNELGTVKYQLSNNGGISWYYHDGVNWSLSGDTLWNTYEEIDININTFLFTGDQKQIRLRAQIKSDATKEHSPRFIKASIYLDYSFNWIEDCKRSLKHYIENNCTINHSIRKLADTCTGYIDIDTKFTIVEIIDVFNITEDSGKINNIYSSLDGNRVFLTTPPDTNDLIEVNFRAKSPVYLTADPDFEKASIPCYIISFGTAINSNLISEGARIIERKKSSLIAKERQYPTYLEVPVEVMSVADTNVTAIQMNQALQEIFEKENLPFLSEAIGEEFSLFSIESYDSRDKVADRVFNKVFSFTMSGKYWYGPAKNKNLIRVVTATFGSNDRVFESVILNEEP